MLALTLPLFVKGQDIHFSSTGFSPMFFNPAMTAFMNARFRVSTIYRNQWQTVARGYNTFFASFEMQPWVNSSSSNGLGLGISFTSDVAGTLSFGEKDIAIAGSYFVALDKNQHSYLSFGVEGIRKNWSMNLQNAEFSRDLVYDDNIRYDELNTYDISFGAAYQYAQDDEHLLYAGVALFHINEPSMTYFEDENAKMHKRLFANLAYMFPMKNNEQISLNPQIFYQHQNKFNEILLGAEMLVNLNNAIFTSEIFSAGLYLRNLDAIVISPKFRYNNFVCGMSYDVNISKLNKASKTYGAVELWLSYAFDPFHYQQKTTKIPCPVF